jgi:hypothetical protein
LIKIKEYVKKSPNLVGKLKNALESHRSYLWLDLSGDGWTTMSGTALHSKREIPGIYENGRE